MRDHERNSLRHARASYLDDPLSEGNEEGVGVSESFLWRNSLGGSYRILSPDRERIRAEYIAIQRTRQAGCFGTSQYRHHVTINDFEVPGGRLTARRSSSFGQTLV